MEEQRRFHTQAGLSGRRSYLGAEVSESPFVQSKTGSTKTSSVAALLMPPRRGSDEHGLSGSVWNCPSARPSLLISS